MADILLSAQTQSVSTGTQTPGDDPVVPTIPDTLVSNNPPPDAPPLPVPDLPFSKHEQEVSVPLADSPSPEPQAPPLPKTISPRRINSSAALSVLILLLVTVPLSVFFVSQKKQVADPRSQAAYVTSENNLYIANLDKTSFSVIWKEQFPAKGCAVAKNTKTGMEAKVCDNILSRMHLIHLTNLAPYLTHEVSALGNKKMSLHAFFGGSVLTGLFDKTKPGPKITEGKILKSDGNPMTDVFVIVTPLLTDRFYFPVAATVDGQGMYRVDLSLIDAQNPPPYETVVVEVVDKSGNTLIEQKVARPTENQLPPVTINE
ncbi:MAG: hypothetical protein Q8L37_06640 [Candidatus Gottesmanbacteria bacterium]|nr:hypothetical protein [Candidatus Gottesmanbacteria bacterium]